MYLLCLIVSSHADGQVSMKFDRFSHPIGPLYLLGRSTAFVVAPGILCVMTTLIVEGVDENYLPERICVAQADVDCFRHDFVPTHHGVFRGCSIYLLCVRYAILTFGRPFMLMSKCQFFPSTDLVAGLYSSSRTSNTCNTCFCSCVCVCSLRPLFVIACQLEASRTRRN